MESGDEKNIAEVTSSVDEETEEMVTSSPDDDSTVQDDSTPRTSSAVRPGFLQPAQSGTTTPSFAQSGTTTPSFAQSGTTNPSFAQSGTTNPSFAQSGTTAVPPTNDEQGTADSSSGSAPISSPRWREEIMSIPGCSSWPEPTLNLEITDDQVESDCKTSPKPVDSKDAPPVIVKTPQEKNPALDSLLGDEESDISRTRTDQKFDLMVKKSRMEFRRPLASKKVCVPLLKQMQQSSIEEKKRLYYDVRERVSASLAESDSVIRSVLAVRIHKLLWCYGLTACKYKDTDLSWDEWIQEMYLLQQEIDTAQQQERLEASQEQQQQRLEASSEQQQRSDASSEQQQRSDTSSEQQQRSDTSSEQQYQDISLSLQQQQQGLGILLQQEPQRMVTSLQQQTQRIVASVQQQPQGVATSVQQQPQGVATSVQQQPQGRATSVQQQLQGHDRALTESTRSGGGRMRKRSHETKPGDKPKKR